MRAQHAECFDTTKAVRHNVMCIIYSTVAVYGALLEWLEFCIPSTFDRPRGGWIRFSWHKNCGPLGDCARAAVIVRLPGAFGARECLADSAANLTLPPPHRPIPNAEFKPLHHPSFNTRLVLPESGQCHPGANHMDEAAATCANCPRLLADPVITRDKPPSVQAHPAAQ